jgi:hypothetical protein
LSPRDEIEDSNEQPEHDAVEDLKDRRPDRGARPGDHRGDEVAENEPADPADAAEDLFCERPTRSRLLAGTSPSHSSESGRRAIRKSIVSTTMLTAPAVVDNKSFRAPIAPPIASFFDVLEAALLPFT